MNDPAYNPGEFKAVDPWAHRSASMSCQTCMWFVEKVSTAETEKPFGRCRKHAPTLQGYPAVFGNDWCGDHKLDENKIERVDVHGRDVTAVFDQDAKKVQDYQEKVKAVREYDLDHVTPGPPSAEYKDPYIPSGTGKPPIADMPSTSKHIHPESNRDTPTAHQL